MSPAVFEPNHIHEIIRRINIRSMNMSFSVYVYLYRMLCLLHLHVSLWVSANRVCVCRYVHLHVFLSRSGFLCFVSLHASHYLSIRRSLC